MPQSQKTLEFLQKLKDKGHWNDDYDYTKVIYINAKTSVILFNKLTETHHNVNPFTLLHRNSKCVIQNAIDKTDFFIKSSKLIHGDIYDYSLTKYVSGNKVKIVCTKHGVFEQAPSKHLNGSGCNSCGNESIGNKLRTTVEEVIQKFKIIHRDKYDYSLVNYSNSKENISIICKIHGVFEQSPESHLSGSGCPTCAGKKITMKDMDVVNVTNMSGMFNLAQAYNQSILGWDTSNVTDMSYMFSEAYSFNQDSNNINTVSVTNCTGFCLNATSWTLPKPNFSNCGEIGCN